MWLEGDGQTSLGEQGLGAGKSPIAECWLGVTEALKVHQPGKLLLRGSCQSCGLACSDKGCAVAGSSQGGLLQGWRLRTVPALVSTGTEAQLLCPPGSACTAPRNLGAVKSSPHLTPVFLSQK